MKLNFYLLFLFLFISKALSAQVTVVYKDGVQTTDVTLTRDAQLFNGKAAYTGIGTDFRGLTFTYRLRWCPNYKNLGFAAWMIGADEDDNAGCAVGNAYWFNRANTSVPPGRDYGGWERPGVGGVTAPNGGALYASGSGIFGKATITTATPSATGSIAATMGLTVVSDGGQTLDKGVIYSTTSMSSNAVPGTGNTKVTISGSGEGAFSNGINGLTPKQLYYVRAYAINASGTTLGNELSITMPTPTITASATTGVGTTTYGTVSTQGSFTVSGVNMAQGILVSAPTGFEVSLSSNGTYTNTLTVGAAGTISSTTVYVRISAAAAVATYASRVVSLNSGTYADLKTSAINSVSVSAAPLTIKASDATKTYGQTLNAVNASLYTITSGTLKNGNTISAVLLTPGNGGAANANVNTYNGTLIPSAATGANGFVAGNYSITYVGGNITVDPATLTYMANSTSRTYGASNPTFTGTVTGFVNGETQAAATTGSLAFSSSATNSSNVGTYGINANGLTANNGNYVFIQASANATALTINPATLTYTANSANRSYGAANPTFTGTVTGFANGQTMAAATTGTLIFSSSATTSSNVGSYAINGSGLTANNGNYIFVQDANNATSLTINPATLTYTANAANRSYGTANPTFTGAVTGFVSGQTMASATTGTLSFSSSATTSSNVGSYAINGSGLTANNGNYVFVQAAGNSTALTINPATLIYTANSASRLYGAVNPTFTGTVTGFANGQTMAAATTGTLAFSSSATTSSNVGAYAINGSGLTANNGNYLFAQAAGNANALTIDPATLTYTANSESRLYGAANPTFTGTATGFVNGQTMATATTGSLTFSSNATSLSNVGSYAINGSGLTANNGNYFFVQTAGNSTALTITPATLTYTANAASRAYGMANPIFTGTLTGFALSDNQANATTGTLTFTSSADLTSPIGQYVINGSGATANNGNYTFTQASANATALTVTKASQVINFASLAAKIYGDAPFALSATGGGSNQTITYVSSNANVATIVGNTVTIVGAGNTTITASQTGDAYYDAAISVDQTLTVNKATQSITFAALTNKIYGDAAFALSATGGGSNNSITYVSSNINVATIVGNTVTIVGAGNTTITASQAGDANYDAASSVDQVLTVDKAAQTITFTALTNKSYGDAAFTLSATGGASSQAITYVSSNTNVATIVGNMVTVIGAGSSTITASQSGDANYAAASDVPQILTINKASQTIIFTVLTNKTYGDAAFALSATGGGSNNSISYASSNTNVATIVGNTVTIVGAGNTTINASQAGDANYDAATPVDQVLTVDKAVQTITFTALANKIYGDAPFALNATGGGSNNPITYVSSNTNVATIVGDLVTIVGAGNTTITASQAGDGSYNAAIPVDQVLTVDKAVQTISFTALTNKTYGDAAFALSATGGASNQTIAYVSSNTNVATIVGNMVTIVGAGNITITASQVGDANYNAATPVDQVLTVDKSAQTISFTALTNKTYGDAAFVLNATSGASNQTITYVSSNTNVATIVGNMVTIVGAGNTTITASQAGDVNYNAASPVDQTLTINKASQSITFAALTNKIYGDAPFALTSTGGGSNQTVTYISSNTNVATIVGNLVTIIGAGSTTITASQAGDANYNAATSLDQVLTVDKAVQSITFAALTNKTYGDAAFTLSATGGASNQTITYVSSNTNVATIVGNMVTIVGAGNTTITASQVGGANYAAASDVPQTLTINKASQSITFAALTNKIYGDAPFALTSTGGGSNQTVTYISSNTNVATIVGNLVTIIGAGSTTITASQLGDVNYNAASPVDQTLTVNKALQSITFAALTNKIYGDAPFALTSTGGGSNQTITYVSSNTNVATIVGNLVTIVGAGSSTITASQVGDANYNAATPVDQVLTVGKAAQTINFATLTNKIYGDAPFILTATGGGSNNPITYVSSNTNVATIVGNLVTIVGAGSSTITASQVGDANYNAATPVDQVLTVGKAAQTINFTTLANKIYGDAPFALTSTGGGSNQTVTYISSNTNVATIVGNLVTIIGAGSTTITASQAGDANYNAATSLDQVLTVDKAVQSITFAALTNKTYGDAAFTLSATGGASNQAITYVSSNTNVATIVSNVVTIIGAGSSTITASQVGDANYDAASDVPQTLTVNKASQTIIFTALTNKTFGDAAFTLSATGGGSNQTMSYVSSNTNVATIVGNMVTIVGAGNTTITASQTGDANYNAATPVDQGLTIGKAAQTITFTTLTNKTYGDVAFALTATGGGSNQAITYVSSNTNVATIVGNMVTIVGAGNTTITTSQAGDANYNAATSVDQVLTVGKAAQTIIFAALANKTYGDATFALTATGGGSNQAITYVSSNTNVATITGNMVTIVGAGNTIITASQVGDGNYNAAAPVDQGLTIGKAAQTITFTALANKTYGDAAFALSATGGASNQTITYVSSNTNVATITGNMVTIVGAGSTTITASQAGDANYTAAIPVDQVLTVDKAAQTITFTALANKIYGDAAFTLSATGGSSNQAITYVSSNTNVATIVGNMVTIVGAGSTTITTSQAGDANYNAAAPVDQVLIVDKAAQTITFTTLTNKTYGDAPFALNATGGGSNNPITYVSSNTNVATIVGNMVTIVGAGNTTITASQAGDGNYNAAISVDQILTVGKAAQTINFITLANKIYGDVPFTLNATGGGSNQPITYMSSNANVATIIGNTVTIVGAGSTTITASQAGDANYNVASPVDQVLTVDKAAQTITFTALANKTYGDAAFTLSATGGSSNQAITYVSSNTNVATIVGNMVTIVGAGNITITASQVGDANYNAAAPVDQVLIVDKAAQTITFTTLTNKTYDAAAFALSATGGASNQTITYVSSNTNVATIVGNMVTIVGAGNTTITASQAGDVNYNAASPVDQTLTINKALQSITFAALTNKIYGNAPFALTSTGGGSNQTITYISSNTNVATIVGNLVTIVGAGNTIITASQAGDANYDAASPVDQVLTVGKAAQTVNFATLANKIYGDAPFILTATGGSSNQTITYVSSNTNVATIVGNLVTIVGAGSSTITASQIGDANYNAATPVDQVLTVAKAVQTITFTALTNKTYGDAPFILTATGGGSNQTITYVSSNTNVATIVGNLVTIVGAGNTIITASQAADGNYNSANPVDQALTVGRAAQAITFTALANKIYGDAPFALNATGGGSNNPITYVSSNTNVVTIVGNLVTIVGAGNTAITASQAGDGNYNAATPVDQVLTVSKATQVITFTTLTNKTYGDATFALTATGGASNQTITYVSSNTNVATIVGNTVTIVGAGLTTITASQAGDGNYNAASPVDQTLTVGKAAQTITFPALANKTYGDATFALTATGGSSNQTITYVSSNTNVATVVGNTVTIIGAGSTTITASQLGDANYNAAISVDQTLTVAKAAQTITFTSLTNKTYGDAPFTLTATGGGSNQTITYISSNTNVATIVGNTVTIVGAGSTTITASQAGNANYDAATPVDQTLTVDKAAQTITFTALANKTYGDVPFTLNATGGGSNQMITYVSSNTNVATIVGNTVTIVGAGSSTITASQAGNGNYNAASPVDQVLTVGKTTQTITFTALTNKIYGDAAFVLNATGGGSNQTITYVSSNTSVATIVGNIVTIVGAGNTTITASQAGNGNYNPAIPVDRTLIIAPKPVTGSFTAMNKTYDGNAIASISDRFLSGILTVDLPNVQMVGGTANFADPNVGAGKIVSPSDMSLAGTSARNYTLIAVTETTADIDQRSITVTADAKAIIYGDLHPTLTYLISNGTLVGTDQMTGSLNKSSGNDAGTYAINLGTLTAGANYRINFVSANFIINKKILTITADDKSRPFNVANPNLTVSYNGFVGTENASSLTTLPTLTTTATITSAAGTYPIVPSAAVAQNYSFSYVNGTLTVGANTTQTISFAPLADKISTDAPFILNASSNVGLTITYTSSDATIARIINGNQVEILKAGTITITASQVGNGNYAAAIPVVQTLKIIDNPAPNIVITSDIGQDISKGETARLTATGAVSYSWSTANGIISGQQTATLSVRPFATTTYTVTGTNQYGRTNTQSITITVKENLQVVTVKSSATNIISPNGDGVNDYFIVRNIDAYPNNTVTILDRTGKILHKVKGYKNDWNGSVNGVMLEEGTYYYLIEFGDGKLNAKRGFITIVKD